MSDLEIEKTMIESDVVCEGEAEAKSDAPEVIRYAATREETVAHLAYLQASLFRLMWGFLLLCQLFWLLPVDGGIGMRALYALLSSGFILFLIAVLYFSRKKLVEKTMAKNPNGYSEYTIWDDYLEYRDYDDNGNVITFYRVAREEVEMATVLPELYVFRKGGVSFSLRRSLVGEGSRYFDIVFPSGVPEARRTLKLGKGRIALPTGTNAYIRLLTVVCAVATLVSLLLFDTIGNRFWIPLLLLAFPIGLLALVLYSAHKRERVRVLPIVCFLLCGAILLLQSFVGVIGFDAVSNRDEVAPYFEAAGVDMPSFTESYTDESSVFDEQTRTFIHSRIVSTYLNEDEADAFYTMVATDTRWQSSTESALYRAFEKYVGYCDVYLIYNVTENTANRLPTGDEVCEYAIFTFTGSYPTLNVTVFEK